MLSIRVMMQTPAGGAAADKGVSEAQERRAGTPLRDGGDSGPGDPRIGLQSPRSCRRRRRDAPTSTAPPSSPTSTAPTRTTTPCSERSSPCGCEAVTRYGLPTHRRRLHPTLHGGGRWACPLPSRVPEPDPRVLVRTHRPARRPRRLRVDAVRAHLGRAAIRAGRRVPPRGRQDRRALGLRRAVSTRG